MIRIFDFAASLLILLISSPFLFIIAMAIKLSSKGPIFYLDKRVGKNKVVFSMFKFRSMRLNDHNEGNWFTSANDSRITRIGLFIRSTSIDEIPQLINVIKGDMSLVGPRPESPFAQKIYSTSYWDKVHLIKPGITGLSQVMGRSSLSLDEKIKYDMEYVNKIKVLSVVKKTAYNIAILFKTIMVVLRRNNSN